MIYCLFWPLTVIDLVPDVMVGVFPQPGELPLTTCLGALRLVVTEGLESLGRHCPSKTTMLNRNALMREFEETIFIKVKQTILLAMKR